MSLSLSSIIICKPYPNHQTSSTTSFPTPIISIRTRTRTRKRGFVFKCELLNEQSFPEKTTRKDASNKLIIGSPVIITEAPEMIKTAASVPCLRVNNGLVNTGDVGR